MIWKGIPYLFPLGNEEEKTISLVIDKISNFPTIPIDSTFSWSGFLGALCTALVALAAIYFSNKNTKTDRENTLRTVKISLEMQKINNDINEISELASQLVTKNNEIFYITKEIIRRKKSISFKVKSVSKYAEKYRVLSVLSSSSPGSASNALTELTEEKNALSKLYDKLDFEVSRYHGKLSEVVYILNKIKMIIRFDSTERVVIVTAMDDILKYFNDCAVYVDDENESAYKDILHKKDETLASLVDELTRETERMMHHASDTLY
ncbi:hypothetical protein M0K80_RS05010 [Providencia rettgeri]|uniref:hypothetical protein n=1 Tax=Providencia alcalifaciens TaxID=126385 RepID=UPI0024ABB86A|nr:hypothetical protein [Providencia rettgeri]